MINVINNVIFLYTGYYALLKKYLNSNLFPIGISSTIPHYLKGIKTYDLLKPDSYLIYNYKNKKINELQYINIYEKWLENLNRENVVNDLLNMSNGKTPILLCYEKYDDFCHRHLVSEWLNKNVNISCIEFY